MQVFSLLSVSYSFRESLYFPAHPRLLGGGHRSGGEGIVIVLLSQLFPVSATSADLLSVPAHQQRVGAVAYPIHESGMKVIELRRRGRHTGEKGREPKPFLRSREHMV